MTNQAAKYPHLLSPITLRGKVYKNRMIAAPTLFAHAVHFLPQIRENVYRMVESRARGGFAAVSTGELCVNFEEGITSFVDRPIDFTRYEGEDFELTREYARRIQKYGAVAYLEFCHEGSRAETKPPYQPWGPSRFIREDGVEALALTREMMEKICQDYKRISRFARACGFDGVLVHGGHGFNMQQFVSPLTNRRTDEFGGTMENRARFPRMLLKAVREGIGEDMVLELRFSAEDGVPGGMTIADTVAFCREIDGLADIIHISNGLKWKGNQTQTFSDFFDVHGVNVEFAAMVKAAVTKSKVAVIGGLNDPGMCEEIIAAGKADFVEFGRQGFADPEFPNKVTTGREKTIRRCVRCFQCYPGSFEHETDKPLWERGMTREQVAAVFTPAAMGRCAINPASGFDHNPDQMPQPAFGRRVLIIGGGPAGLQAAVTARQRGHQVTLAEKTDRLGGTVNFTDLDQDKVDLRNFKNPPIPGIELGLHALSAYYHPEKIGRKVVLIGGGLVGCEVGLHLAAHGHLVTIVEMQPMMAPETFCYYRNALLEEMEKRNIVQLLEARCLEFTQTGVRIEQQGTPSFLTADTCVYSMGMRPDEDTVNVLLAAAGPVPTRLIGDCRQAGKLGDAVRAGYLAAMEIL